MRSIDELLNRQALLRRVGVSRGEEYFAALVPETDDRSRLLWLKPSGERRP